VGQTAANNSHIAMPTMKTNKMRASVQPKTPTRTGAMPLASVPTTPIQTIQGDPIARSRMPLMKNAAVVMPKTG
jgi:hypothetical protein